jgi:glycosyl-4,4'-diaponeurosporenoate acyltransferase
VTGAVAGVVPVTGAVAGVVPVPLVTVPLWVQAVGGTAVWLVASVGFGFLGHRLRPERLDRDRGPTHLTRWERDGRLYERRLRIRRWKDRLPEAGGLFAGGVSKRALPDHSDAVLARLVVETRRAELVHWALAVLGPTFLLWCHPAVAVVMVLYGLVANVPCLVVQRYNRARLNRSLAARRRRAGRPGPSRRLSPPPGSAASDDR